MKFDLNNLNGKKDMTEVVEFSKKLKGVDLGTLEKAEKRYEDILENIKAVSDSMSVDDEYFNKLSEYEAIKTEIKFREEA